MLKKVFELHLFPLFLATCLVLLLGYFLDKNLSSDSSLIINQKTTSDSTLIVSSKLFRKCKIKMHGRRPVVHSHGHRPPGSGIWAVAVTIADHLTLALACDCDCAVTVAVVVAAWL